MGKSSFCIITVKFFHWEKCLAAYLCFLYDFKDIYNIASPRYSAVSSSDWRAITIQSSILPCTEAIVFFQLLCHPYLYLLWFYNTLSQIMQPEI